MENQKEKEKSVKRLIFLFKYCNSQYNITILIVWFCLRKGLVETLRYFL